MGDASHFIGKYELVSSENLDECLKACGVGYIVRKLLGLFSSVSELEKAEDDYWIARFKIGPKQTEFKFKTGQTVEVTTFHGKTTHLFTIEGSKLKELRTDSYGECETIREYTADGINWTMQHLPSGVKASGFSKRLPKS